MKRSELVFNIVSIFVDIISLILAGLVSFYIRIKLDPYIPIVFTLHLHSYLKFVAEAVPAILAIFALTGLYNLKGTRRFSREFQKIIVGMSLSLLIVILLFFFNQNIFPSRLILLEAWVTGIALVVIGRFILRRIQVRMLRSGKGLHRLVIIRDENDQQVVEDVKNKPELGYKIIAELSDMNTVMEDLQLLYEKEGAEEIMQTHHQLPADLGERIVQFARDRGIVFNYVPNTFDVHKRNVESTDIEGIPVIALKSTPLDGWGRVYKRAFDILVSLVCFLITLPAFIIISIWIKLTSPGKVLYAAPRGGRGKDFIFYKFRTMHSHLSVGEGYGGEEAERVRQELWKINARGGEKGEFLKIKDDPRVTKVGKFLRKTKLDEIPQFLNVLKGEMSMVGPRAHVIDEVERYRNRYPRMFTVKPGIFGASQIAQLSWPDLPFEEEIKLNTNYIENWSIWTDLIILVKTFYYLFLSARSKGDY